MTEPSREEKDPGHNIDDLDFEVDIDAIKGAANRELTERFDNAMWDYLGANYASLNKDFYPWNERELLRALRRVFILGYKAGRLDNGSFMTRLGLEDPAEFLDPLDFTEEQ